MANPQKENGYTAISNEIMEQLAKHSIPGEARQVLDTVLRQTYGWQKRKNARLSLTFLQRATSLKRPNVVRALTYLKTAKLIKRIENDTTYGTSYSFNKDYEEWSIVSKRILVSKTIISGIENDNKAVSKTIPKITIYKQVKKQGVFSLDFQKEIKNLRGIGWKDQQIKEHLMQVHSISEAVIDEAMGKNF